MSKQTEHTLPSGRKIVLRETTALDTYRIQGSLPDVSGAGEQAEVQSLTKIYEAGIRMLCLLCVKPLFWADLRDATEVMNSPATCPPGRIVFDLSNEDFARVMEIMGEVNKAEAERVRPLPETQGPS